MFRISFLSLFIISLLSCGKNKDVNPVSLEDLYGTWTCIEEIQTGCDDPNDNGNKACNSSITFNSDLTVSIINSGESNTDGTYELNGNLLILHLEIGVIDEVDFGTLTSDPIEISIRGDVLTYRQTTKDLDECYSTLKLERAL